MTTENANKSKVDSGYKNPDPYFMVPKLMYFLLNWFIYSTHGFYMQYLGSSWGFNPTDVNLTYLWQFVTIFSGPFWGSLADRTGRFRQVAAFCVIMNCICLCLMAYPVFDKDSWLRHIYFHLLSTATAIFSSGTFPIIDAIVLSVLEADPTTSKDDYSFQKIFGSISHNICATGIHWLYETFSDDYFVMFYSASTAMVMLVATIMYGVSDKVKIKAHKHHGPAKTSDGESNDETTKITALQMALKPEYLLFLIVVLAAGVVRCVNTNNHSLYLTDILFVDKNQLAWLMWVRLIVEIPLLIYAKKLMLMTGPYWFLITGLFVGVFRMFLYAMLEPDHCMEWFYYLILVLIEILKGANSSLISAGAFRIASDLAPAHLQASSQTYVAACWQGLSMTMSALMALLISKLFDDPKDSMKALFNYTTFLGFISFVIIFVYFAFVKKVLF